MAARAVVFDLGMVISAPDRLFERVGEILGASASAVELGFWGPHRHAYDEGGDDLDFWRRALELIERERDDEVLSILDDLVAADTDGWRTPRPAARDLLRRLQAAGVSTAILSNAPRSFAAAAPGFDWYDVIGTWFFSGALGVAKPAPEIYAAVERALDMRGEQLWFIDDKQVNVNAARRRRWHAHLWVDDADTEAWLVAEGFLPS